jgi:hypothetical protein
MIGILISGLDQLQYGEIVMLALGRLCEVCSASWNAAESTVFALILSKTTEHSEKPGGSRIYRMEINL